MVNYLRIKRDKKKYLIDGVKSVKYIHKIVVKQMAKKYI